MRETGQAEQVSTIPSAGVIHREDEYNSRGFDLLTQMQERHFWYVGRHRFLFRSLCRCLGRLGDQARPPRVIDLGGGCGGWLAYLLKMGFSTRTLALADSSALALGKSRQLLPDEVERHQIDLLDLPWDQHWDVAFLLDVLEHIPQQEQVLREIHRMLVPGGLLFVTTPALNFFWSWNDEWAEHQRRYSKADFRRLAGECGYRLLDARYFMFFLSPLLLASRLATTPRVARLSAEELWCLQQKLHKVPSPVVNGLLAAVFSCETPLGHYLPFPWGTSVLAVLQKPL
jgi:SAM-dependent methyltransferase